MKKCPYCAESIQDAAKVCRHCGRDLKRKSSAVSMGCAAALALTVAMVGVIGFCGYIAVKDHTPIARSQTDVQNSMRTSMAKIQCRNYMRDTLKSPSTAEFPGMLSGSQASAIGKNRYALHEWVDAQNAFGATIRSNYQCTISYKGSGRDADRRNWTLEKLVVDGKQVR